jgi:sulfur-carrier protein adenylyltransferase/sulfurtransferase
METLTYREILNRLRSEVREVSVEDVRVALQSGARTRLVDIREREERSAGWIPGSVWVPRGLLEMRLDRFVLHEEPIVLYCSAGIRSVFGVRSLKELGYLDVASMAGGFSAWRSREFSVEGGAAQVADQPALRRQG